jgi:hypothetical protein
MHGKVGPATGSPGRHRSARPSTDGHDEPSRDYRSVRTVIAPIPNGHDTPWGYAETRLVTCGRVISTANDKVVAFHDVAAGLGRDVREGFLNHVEVADRLTQLADAYGLTIELGADAIQSVIVEGLEKPSLVLGKEWSRTARRSTPSVPIKIKTAAALRTRVFEPIKYIVPSYIVEGCTILAGRPKLGKSWLMLDIGLAVAVGGCCLGDAKCAGGNVLYLAMEDNERRLQSRITKIMGYGGEWPPGFEYATEWPRANVGGLDEIRRWIASVERPRLVVVDVLAMFRSPRDLKQSPYDADYETIQQLQRIASDAACALPTAIDRAMASAAEEP